MTVLATDEWCGRCFRHKDNLACNHIHGCLAREIELAQKLTPRRRQFLEALGDGKLPKGAAQGRYNAMPWLMKRGFAETQNLNGAIIWRQTERGRAAVNFPSQLTRVIKRGKAM